MPDDLKRCSAGISINLHAHRRWNPCIRSTSRIGPSYRVTSDVFKGVNNPHVSEPAIKSHVSICPENPDSIGVVSHAWTVDQIPLEIGRASCRERVCQYVKISEGAGS